MSFTDTVVWICLLLKLRNLHSLDSLNIQNDKETHTDCSDKVWCNQRYSAFTLSVCQCVDVEIALSQQENDMGAKYGDDGDESGKLLLQYCWLRATKAYTCSLF